jgi:hypothetical protein
MERKIWLYIDKENIHSLMRSADKDTVLDCFRLIKKNIDVHYNFSKEEAEKDSDIRAWFLSVKGQGVKNQDEFSLSDGDKIPNHLLSVSDFDCEGEEDVFGIFLVNQPERCRLIHNHHCVLIGDVGEEVNVLKQLLDIHESCENFIKDVQWSTFCPSLPLTDIVLCDPYYFKDKTIYQKNKNELLKVLSSIPKKFPINVVIITHGKHVDCNLNMKEELDTIQELVRDSSGNANSDVTIVSVKNTAFHDRALITNYYRINSTGGFQKEGGGLKSDVRVEVRSHTSGKNYETSLQLVECYKKAIRRLDWCYGDKTSNFDLFG